MELDPRRRRAQVRLPRRALPVPALGRALAPCKDLRRGTRAPRRRAPTEDATGHAPAATAPRDRDPRRAAAARGAAAGLRAGSAYDLSEGALLGRGDQADIRLEDAFASSRHARLVPQGDVMVLGGSGLHQRHVPERGAAARPAAPARRATRSASATASSASSDSSADGLRIAEHFGTLRPRPAAPGQRGQLLRARAAVRRRRRHGRRAGRRGRVGDGRRGLRRGLPDGDAAPRALAQHHRGGQPAHPRPLAHRRRSAPGMGTTLTAAYVGERRGHDRATSATPRLPAARRRARAPHRRPLAGRRAVARGKLTEEQAETHPQRSVITRALGPEPRRAGRRRDRSPRAPATSSCLLGRPDLDGPRGRGRADPASSADSLTRPAAS